MVFATPRSLYPLPIVPHITVDDEYDSLQLSDRLDFDGTETLGRETVF
jgi:hypothetical protein